MTQDDNHSTDRQVRTISIIETSLQDSEPFNPAFQTHTPVQRPGAIVDSDLHGVAAGELGDRFEVEAVDNLRIERGQFNVRYKTAFYASLLLIRERRVWSIFLRPPRRARMYARKYARKRPPGRKLDESRGEA